MTKIQTTIVSRRKLMKLGASLLAVSALGGCAPIKGGNAPGSRDAQNGGDAMGSQDSQVPSGTSSSQAPQEGTATNTQMLQEVTVAATDGNVRIIGRSFEEGGAIWLPQSGSAIEFEVIGTHVYLDVVCDENAYNRQSLQPRFAVLIGGTVVVDGTLNEQSSVIDVPLSDVPVKAVIEFIHLSEASLGAVGLQSITVETIRPDPITPTTAKRLHIGFIGDSITCAYGVEATDTYDSFKTTTQNFMKSYAYLAARELYADYDTVCYSGYGVVSGTSGWGERNDEMLVPPIYELVCESYAQTWDFKKHPSDVVVVNLGTNDFSYTGTDEERMLEFSYAYTEFLARIRELNPDSLIVCTLGTMGDSGALYPALEQAVKDHQERTGDTRIKCYLSAPMDVEADGSGTDGHPSEATHRKMAQELVRIIRNG